MSRYNPKIYFRGVIGLLMLIIWSAVLTTGILMWLAPHGQGRGSEPFLFNLTRHDWGDLHLYLALTAVVITIIHVVADWKIFVSSLKHMVRSHQGAG
ncbi:MAG: DUF4405 domain-containing protein [Balneolaceae bacterium]|jgi:hypothetical protein|nr:MAG: DUF4405 domain-containing protein [Balneolaceae bacterium]